MSVPPEEQTVTCVTFSKIPDREDMYAVEITFTDRPLNDKTIFDSQQTYADAFDTALRLQHPEISGKIVVDVEPHTDENNGIYSQYHIEVAAEIPASAISRFVDFCAERAHDGKNLDVLPLEDGLDDLLETIRSSRDEIDKKHGVAVNVM